MRMALTLTISEDSGSISVIQKKSSENFSVVGTHLLSFSQVSERNIRK